MIQNLVYNLCESFTENIDGVAGICKTRPPQEEILAPATFEVTLKYVDGYYWATFYTSMANYQAPDGVRVYKVNLNGSQFTNINIEDGIINKRQGVVLRSSTSSVTLTKTYSKSSDDYSNNSLIGTDYQITNPGNAYVLNYKQSHGLSFYPLSSKGKIKANAAYLIMIFTYLTQWKIVGNSEVHTDPYLTSWKVSGNSVVQDGAIMSCGDLGQDGKYHVKISNGVTIFDIPLDAPLRKVNDVADTIEFPSSTEGKALVTRNFKQILLSDYSWIYSAYSNTYVHDFKDLYVISDMDYKPNLLVEGFDVCTYNMINDGGYRMTSRLSNNYHYLYISAVPFETSTEFRNYINGKSAIYQLETPTTELVDAPQIAVSPTNTYTSANVVPYSAFEHTENKEIWSCGEYNATDGKYHILVQPQGGSIVDIALTEPLRKINNVADTIEFPSGIEGKVLVTRNILSYLLENLTWTKHPSENRYYAVIKALNCVIPTNSNISVVPLILCNKYTTVCFADRLKNDKQLTATRSSSDYISVIDSDLTSDSDIQGEILLQLATPTTELVDAPQIEEADSYSMVISQGGKAVEWSSFETE